MLNGQFTLNGADSVCLDGVPPFTFNESISFVESRKGQDEIDCYWSSSRTCPSRSSAAGAGTGSA
ncbi:hypothetical protein ASG80_17365 [Agromyces sp. Soil535]|nr:hypothetical protein ASG80_17365 [Agromyces sp. Soil535]